MYSTIINKEVQDWRFKKICKGHYAFYIGDKLIGQMIGHRKNWACISQHPPSPSFFPVHGFKARIDCAQFLISYHRIGDFYKYQEKEEQEELERQKLLKEI